MDAFHAAILADDLHDFVGVFAAIRRENFANYRFDQASLIGSQVAAGDAGVGLTLRTEADRRLHFAGAADDDGLTALVFVQALEHAQNARV